MLIYNFPVLMLLAKGFLPLDARFTRFCAIDVGLALFFALKLAHTHLKLTLKQPRTQTL